MPPQNLPRNLCRQVVSNRLGGHRVICAEVLTSARLNAAYLVGTSRSVRNGVTTTAASYQIEWIGGKKEAVVRGPPQEKFA